jgi:carbon starvation protein
MNATPIVIATVLIFILAYRYYYGFVEARLAMLNDGRITPAKRLFDGQNYYPMNKWVLFGHHFAAIAGAGPLVGPVLAVQFGYCPGLIWILAGAVIAGAMHDFIILIASVRYDGKSLVEIASAEINKLSGITASVAVLIILVIAIAGLGMVVVNALAESAWGTFTIAATIPIALLIGVWMFRFRKGKTAEATIIGIILLIAAVVFGKYVPDSLIGSWFIFDKKTLTLLLAGYGFFASVLPVWLLLSPRDYLSSFMKLGVVALLGLGIIIVSPNLKMPAFTTFIHGGGPVIPGPLFPYLFITIACGAVSGFHALVSSGTTPKMLMNESEIKMISAGAMLAEGAVSILALLAAASLLPLDYFKINIPVEKFGQFAQQLHDMGFRDSNITELSKQVGENITGRTGGAVSLAVGMSQIFSSIPGFKGLMSYWYHFAIMFEALFILTTIDAGTRIGRFIIQEAFGKIYKPFAQTNWLPGNLIASGLFVSLWAYFIYSGSVSTIWPMFGAANQLLATIALTVGTSFIINNGKKKYAWFTLIPMIFVGVTTLSACWLNMTNIYWPQVVSESARLKGVINLTLTLIIMLCAITIILNAIPNWIKAFKNNGQ